MRNEEFLVTLWHRILNASHEDIFAGFEHQARKRCDPFDRLPQPGFVGSKYIKGGLLLLGKNPGNDPGKEMSPADRLQLAHLTELKNSLDFPQTTRLYVELMTALEDRVMPQWTIFRNVVSPLLGALDLDLRHCAYLNIFKFHTADSNISAHLFKRSWAQTKEQIEALEPNLIVALGKGTYDRFLALQKLAKVKTEFRTYCINRHIGDTKLPENAKTQIASIAAKERSYLDSVYKFRPLLTRTEIF